jgi:hypothetical protein
MNILPPVPTPTVFNVGTVNTESVRRDNTQREAVPPLAANEKSAAETGVGSEADKVKTPGKSPQPLTYEKPVPQTGQQLNTQNDATQDNGQDASAGKENAEDKQQQQAEQKQLKELKQRDTEVRAHEQAHASIGGQYASSPKYHYERGPDGKRYAVDGEVSIDISKTSSPEETIRKAQQVKAAALAPAEPSAQDLRVATEATKLALEARTEIAAEIAKEFQEAYNQAIPDIQKNEERSQNSVIGETPSLEDIVDSIDVGIPTRSLDISQSGLQESPADPDFDLDVANEYLKNRDLDITRRVSVIESFYKQVTNPRSEGLQQSA